MRLVYRYMVILCLFFIVPDTLRADGEDVLERMISLPKMKGTVYSLLGNISQQSGYLLPLALLIIGIILFWVSKR